MLTLHGKQKTSRKQPIAFVPAWVVVTCGDSRGPRQHVCQSIAAQHQLRARLHPIKPNVYCCLPFASGWELLDEPACVLLLMASLKS